MHLLVTRLQSARPGLCNLGINFRAVSSCCMHDTEKYRMRMQVGSLFGLSRHAALRQARCHR